MKRRLLRPAFGALSCIAALTLFEACAPKKALVFEQTVPLESGRFAGPVAITLPPLSADGIRELEIRTTLESACSPQLRVAYPDGETGRLGSKSARWQELLQSRAEANTEVSAASAEAPAETPTQQPADAPTQQPAQVPTQQPAQTPTQGQPQQPSQTPAQASAPEQYLGPSAAPTGHWQRTTTEQWPGQLEFIMQRDTRCKRARRYRQTYRTAVDETSTLTVWAEVPQELAGASLTVRVYEVTWEKRERDAKERAERKRRKRERLALSAHASVRAETPPKPKPKPKKESPGAPKTEGATWVPGYWVLSGRGTWVWRGGHWQKPRLVPAGKAENPGAPPIAGCTWQSGHWVWEGRKGVWRWVDGHWNAPPPRQEVRGPQPVPESPWRPGRWVRAGVSFRWVAGFWDTPRPRAQTRPAPPYAGAQWLPGRWLKLRGQWIWSPGYYASSATTPPPPKSENPGPSPQQGAVWLAGFWRWDDAAQSFAWIAGHWELPPGEGYEWVPDPPDPRTGVSTGGRWKLILEVPVQVEVRP